MKEKKCTRCGQFKPLDQYYNLKKSKDGKYHQCKECKDEAHKEWKRRQTRINQFFKNWLEIPDMNSLAHENMMTLKPVYEAYEKHALEAPEAPYEHPIKYKLGSRPIKEGLVFKGDYLYIRTKKGVMEKRIDLCTPDTLGKILAHEGIEVIEIGEQD